MHQISVHESDATCKLDTYTDLMPLWLQATLYHLPAKESFPAPHHAGVGVDHHLNPCQGVPGRIQPSLRGQQPVWVKPHA